jgi:DNA-binding CsgD family transcriptional regulator
MAHRERLTTSAEREAFQSVKRACYAGLDSVTLRTEVARRAAGIVPFDAQSFSTTDPDTGLLTHGVGEGLSMRFVQAYLYEVYPHEEAMTTLDLVRSGRTVSTSDSHAFRDILRVEGLAHELKVLPCANGDLWGSWCLMRETGSPCFSEREMRFLRIILPHLAHGLRSAALVDRAFDQPGLTADGEPTGVIILAACGRISLRNPTATAQLDDLGDVGIGTQEIIPFAVASAVAWLRVRQESDAELRVRGRSGRWYTLRASLTEPDASGTSSTIVLIEPVTSREIAPILAQLYGLSPREREVLSLVARGEPTKRIAAQLGVSAYTVQDHVGHACEKVGVRGRKALLAKLFFDGHVPHLAG